MSKLTFTKCTVYLTVAELVAPLKWTRGTPPCGWREEQFPKERQGVHPEVQFACQNELVKEFSLNAAQAEVCGMCLSAGARAALKTVCDTHFFESAHKAQNDLDSEEKKKDLDNKKRILGQWRTMGLFAEQVGRIEEAVSDNLELLRKLLAKCNGTSGLPSIKDNSFFARVLPTGVATLTLKLELKTPVADTSLDALLKRLDPRRLTYKDADEWKANVCVNEKPAVPDLLQILDAMVLDLQLHLAEGPKCKWEKLQEACRDAETWNSTFGKRLLNIGRSARITEPDKPDNPANKLATAGSNQGELIVQMLPYCTLDCELDGSDFWPSKTQQEQSRTEAHRRIHHLVAGTYLPIVGKSEKVPDRLCHPDANGKPTGILKSCTWSDGSLLMGTSRGSGLFFKSPDNPDWELHGPLGTKSLKDNYREATINAVEQVLGIWASLGALHVFVDKTIREITSDPLANVEPLEQLARAREIFTHLLGEPLLYQLEGGSLLAFQKQLREEFAVDHLRDLLFRKLESVKDYHDLRMHLIALRQIAKEHGHAEG